MLMDEVLGILIRLIPSTPIDNIPNTYGQVANIILELASITFPGIGMVSADNPNHDVTHCVFDDFSIHPAFSNATAYQTLRFGRFLEEKKNEIPRWPRLVDTRLALRPINPTTFRPSGTRKRSLPSPSPGP
jgi:hypothetical protein